jgi:branched-chain amino acid transport system substrate-binding protein
MKSIKLILTLFIAGTLVGIGLWQYRQESSPVRQTTNCTQGDTIRIGAVYTFTGNLADIGESFREGTEIAKEQINAAGGIHGKQLEIIYEDAPDYETKAGVNATQKLISNDKVCAVLNFVYGSMGGLENLAKENQVPVIDPIDASDEISKFGDWIFSTGVYDDGIGMTIAEFAKNEKRLDKVAMLIGQDQYLLAVANGFKQTFVSQGGEILIDEKFVIGTQEFKTQLAKIIQTNPQAIFVGQLGEGGVIIKQARELGYQGIFLGTDTFSLADVQRAAGSHINENLYFALWRNFDATTSEQNEFAKTYKERYGKEAKDYLFYNVLGYDGLAVLAQALENSDLTSGDLQKQLYQIKDFPGLSGPITIDSTGISRDHKSAIVLYKDSQIVRYQK